MTSSGSVPFNFSPNIVKNIVKFIGPGASFIIASRYWSVGFLPCKEKNMICAEGKRTFGSTNFYEGISKIFYFYLNKIHDIVDDNYATNKFGNIKAFKFKF